MVIYDKVKENKEENKGAKKTNFCSNGSAYSERKVDSKINQIICKTLHERCPIKFATGALLVERKCATFAKRSLGRAFYLKRNIGCCKCEAGTHINSFRTN